MALIKDFASSTIKESHFYADGTSGDDANDGKTPATPKKTLAAVSALVPYELKHNVAVHLSGVFNYPDVGRFNVSVDSDVSLLIDGGDSLTVIDDNSGSNYTATAASTSSITDGAASWVVDSLFGYWIKILTGPAAGQMRTIHGNTATAITPTMKFSVSPGIGATFVIYRPSTELVGGSTYGTQECKLDITNVGFGNVVVQNLYTSGGYAYFAPFNGRCILRAIIANSTASATGCIFASGNNLVACWGYSYLDPTTFADDALIRLGFSQIHASGWLYYLNNQNVQFFASVARRLKCDTADLFFAGYGNRFLGKPLELLKVKSTFGFAYDISTSAQTKIDNSDGVGVLLDACNITLSQYSPYPLSISNSASHAIQMKNNSILTVEEVIEGSGNGGAGIMAYGNSQVLVKDGVVPTVTGTVGDISVDGTVQDATWAQIPVDPLVYVNRATVKTV